MCPLTLMLYNKLLLLLRMSVLESLSHRVIISLGTKVNLLLFVPNFALVNML